MEDQCKGAKGQLTDWDLLLIVHELSRFRDKSIRRDQKEIVQREQIQIDPKSTVLFNLEQLNLRVG